MSEENTGKIDEHTRIRIQAEAHALARKVENPTPPPTLGPIDELIKELNKRRAEYEQSNNADCVINWGNGIKIAVGIIQAHRPSIEAGMRGVLRFRIIPESADLYLAMAISSVEGNEHWGWDLIRDDDESRLKIRCERFAERLNLRAEFVPEEELDKTEPIE